MSVKFSLTILLACCLIVNASDTEGCPENFELVGGMCYQIHLNDKNNWYEATRYCKRANAELLTIESSVQMEELVEFLKKSQSSEVTPESVWTAGTDLGSLGSFYWQSNGKEFEYSKWIKYQPEFSHRHQHCVELNWDQQHDYHMQNVNCETSLAFVCEAIAAIDFETK